MFKLAIFLAFLTSAFSFSPRPLHQYSPDVSSRVANAIRDKLLENLTYISNLSVRDQLKKDLLEDDDSKRGLKEIDTTSVKQIFAILKLPNQNCDSNGDGLVKDVQLKCLNIIWKSYVPTDAEQQ